MDERDLIRSIALRNQVIHPTLGKGIGDDCAVFSAGDDEELLISSDMLLEDIHFKPDWHSPYLLGRKSLAVNLSDIAAMGGAPRFALLCIGLPDRAGGKWAAAFMEGFFSLLQEYHCALIGGDTVAAAKITLSVTVVGACPRNTAVKRSGAQAGDVIYVSGPLGSSAAGLFLLQQGETTTCSAQGEYTRLVEKHLDPAPRVALGMLLRKSGMVNAMQDISDGIATDLSHICSCSRTGAVLHEQQLPADEPLLALCAKTGQSASTFQLSGGEDYELLFTVPQRSAQRLEQLVMSELGVPIFPVGEIVAGEGVVLRQRSGAHIDVSYQGWEHHL